MPDVCPSCGDFTEELNLETGWCFECSPVSSNNGAANYQRIERWLEVNADNLEYHISQGLSLWQAIDHLAKDRPKCVVCGSIITHASRASVFCRKTAACRRYSRRYVYLYRERKPRLSKVEALATILEELS